jgi:hypothetical protein
MYKLTPSYYIKKGLKAETPADMYKANAGLFELMKNHFVYTMTSYIVGVSLVGAMIRDVWFGDNT